MDRLLRYVGAKDLRMKNLVDYLDCGIQTYCEPFGGSFYTGFVLAEANENIKCIFNDIQPDIYNFWCCIKEDVFKFRSVLSNAYDEISAYSSLDEQMHYLETDLSKRDKFSMAAATYIIHEGRRFLRSRYTENLRNKRIPDASTCLIYNSVADRISMFNLDFADIIAKVDSEETLFFLDPPYYVVNVGSYYMNYGHSIYHKGLAELLHGIKGKFLLSYNNDRYISSLYSDMCQYLSDQSIYKNEIYIANFEIDLSTMEKVLRAEGYGYVGRIRPEEQHV